MIKSLGKLVLDTSILMENKHILEKVVGMYDVYVHIVTLEELDNLKTNKDGAKAKRARNAIKEITKFDNQINYLIHRKVHEAFIQSGNVVNTYNYNDDIIVSSASFLGAYLATEDLNLRIKARAIGVECICLNGLYDVYKGFVEYHFSSDEYNEYYEHRADYFDEYNINQYIIIKDHEDNNVDELRFNGQDLVRLKLPSSKIIKGKNALQRCALDMLNNNDIKICAILGKMGSGKSYLALRSAFNLVCNSGKQSKVLGIREPIGEGREIGYLKGDYQDKTAMFFTPLVHSLDGGEYELQGRMGSGQFETQIPYFMKGTTYNETIMVCDEAEDLSERQIRLIGTRLGENSRIFFSGDYKQGIFDSTTTNPLVKMCQELKGNPMFGCIFLDTDVRSEASKIFADLYLG